MNLKGLTGLFLGVTLVAGLTGCGDGNGEVEAGKTEVVHNRHIGYLHTAYKCPLFGQKEVDLGSTLLYNSYTPSLVDSLKKKSGGGMVLFEGNGLVGMGDTRIIDGDVARGVFSVPRQMLSFQKFLLTNDIVLLALPKDKLGTAADVAFFNEPGQQRAFVFYASVEDGNGGTPQYLGVNVTARKAIASFIGMVQAEGLDKPGVHILYRDKYSDLHTGRGVAYFPQGVQSINVVPGFESSAITRPHFPCTTNKTALRVIPSP